MITKAAAVDCDCEGEGKDVVDERLTFARQDALDAMRVTRRVKKRDSFTAGSGPGNRKQVGKRAIVL
ncbi:hypothetical protein LTR16_006118, partial [Cryomyces antarcticus]